MLLTYFFKKLADNTADDCKSLSLEKEYYK